VALTNEEQARLRKIEAALAEHTIAINNLAAKKQLSHVLALVQADLRKLNEQLTSIKAQLEVLKNKE
jgi:hypothetical protein